MKAKVDKDLCIGCQLCTCLAPDSFKMEDDGKAVALEGNLDPEKTKEAEISCPVYAISTED